MLFFLLGAEAPIKKQESMKRHLPRIQIVFPACGVLEQHVFLMRSLNPHKCIFSLDNHPYILHCQKVLKASVMLVEQAFSAAKIKTS